MRNISHKIVMHKQKTHTITSLLMLMFLFVFKKNASLYKCNVINKIATVAVCVSSHSVNNTAVKLIIWLDILVVKTLTKF